MSKNWSEGYFSDVGYTYGYYKEISPVFLRFCLLLQGLAAPATEDMNYCDKQKDTHFVLTFAPPLSSLMS